MVLTINYCFISVIISRKDRSINSSNIVSKCSTDGLINDRLLTCLALTLIVRSTLSNVSPDSYKYWDGKNSYTHITKIIRTFEFARNINVNDQG